MKEKNASLQRFSILTNYNMLLPYTSFATHVVFRYFLQNQKPRVYSYSLILAVALYLMQSNIWTFN